jgi:predicted NAD/FAD-binding protein
MTVASIGVIGGGIGGLASAWLLDSRYRITLLEANDYVGGHTHTLTVDDPRGAFPVDTGFMVFNRPNYPLLTGMFRELGVATYPTCMSFAASLDGGATEFAGSDLNSLFGQRSNLLRPGFVGMLLEILRFNRAARAFLSKVPAPDLSLGDFLERGGYSGRFATQYLLPMAAAIWSCPTDQMRAFPFLSFARFFKNHGLLSIVDRPDWETVRGGSRVYVERILARMRGEVRTRCPVRQVRRVGDGVEVVTESGERLAFDAVVFGCHGDQALGLMADASRAERELLGAFRYQPNQVYLHTDRTLMPRRRRVWSSWNYLRPAGGSPEGPVTVTYWMNRLQDLPTDRDIFVSLNPIEPPRPETVIAELAYDHPVFDSAALAAQGRIAEIQGRERLWFAGAYLGYGFHEDGLRSAVAVAEGLGVSVPWMQDADARPAALRGPAPGLVAETASP